MIDPQAYALHHARAQRLSPKPSFLFTHVHQELLARMPERPVSSVLHLSSLTLPERSFDVITSCLLLHWISDVQGYLHQIKTRLRPGGLFLGALWGGQTLCELRESFLAAELSLTGGASPRVAPMIQPEDATLLLGKAGFRDPVVDTEMLTVTYPSVRDFMYDLRAMGETNILEDRQKTFSSRRLFEKIEQVYQETFGTPDGKIPATFEVIYLTGGEPTPSVAG